jgi:hypothetical protein
MWTMTIDRIPAQFLELFVRDDADDADDCARARGASSRAASDAQMPSSSDAMTTSARGAPAFVTELYEEIVGGGDGVGYDFRVERAHADARAALRALKCALAHPLCVPDVVANGGVDANYLKLTASAVQRRRVDGVVLALAQHGRQTENNNVEAVRVSYDGLSLADARLVDELQATLAELKSRVSALEVLYSNELVSF